MPVPITSGEIQDRIRASTAAVEAIVKDGLQLGDLLRILSEAPRVMEAVEQIQGLDGTRKRTVVVDAITPILRRGLAHIDLPWVPAPIEARIWDLLAVHVLPLVVGLVCDLVARATKGGIGVNRGA